MAWIRRRARVIVGLASAVLCCALAELALQGQRAFKTPMCVRVADPRLYGLNPAYPEISSLGFRNREIAVPKPPGVYRVVILGDSVAFGVGVERPEAFPQRMNRILAGSDRKIEVVNCGVPGYSTYNELELYRQVGATLDADLVMLSVCLNDVVNPRLHWATAGLSLEDVAQVPVSAIPDPESDRRRVLPMLAERRRMEAQRPLVTRSLFISSVFDALATPWTPVWKGEVPKTPTYLAFEDPTSIEVLCHDGSQQWKWLQARLGDVNRSVTEQQRKLIVLFFPLAYQMDEGYPLSPQTRLTASCTANSISSVDVLPTLLKHSKAKMFRLGTGDYYDIWHLTSRGHEVVAEMLCAYVLESRARSLPVAIE